MYQLKDFVEIDPRFQSAVNLQLDLESEKKINSYIPTRSSLGILNTYLQKVLEKEGQRATVLIGPYGKGKSHLLLVLLNILRQNPKKLQSLRGRIEKVDANSAALIEKVEKTRGKYLPVIVSGGSEELNQSFLMGLLEALKREGLEEISPESDYTEALKVIATWKREYALAYGQFQEALRKNHWTVEGFTDSLKKMNASSMELFKAIYEQVTFGASFSPMVQRDCMKVYTDINNELCRNHGYSGIYLIFDEFSKYIEGHEKETFSRDMKTLQDMCELSNNSKGDAQIHLTFVAHKSIKEYGKQLPKEMTNAFLGVEGRLQEILFVVSSQNNYELVASAIQKKGDRYLGLLEEQPKMQALLWDTYKMPCFASMFTKEEYQRILVRGCFPLLPMTAYTLLNISEKAAQNERSIFTFLSNKGAGSLYSMIQEKRENWFLGVDVVYDYFANLFREDTGFTKIHSEWLKAEEALKFLSKEQLRGVIKTIALYHMIDKKEELPVGVEMIAYGMGITVEEAKEAMAQLEEKNLVLFRPRSNTYVIKYEITVNLREEIKKEMDHQTGILSVPKALKKISELEYVLPKQHNQEYQMTRFFSYEYMEEKTFLEDIKEVKYLFEEHFSDGKILAILPEKDGKKQAVLEKTQALGEENLVVIYPRNGFDQTENLKKLEAVLALQQDEKFLEDNKVLEQELSIYEEDLKYEINAALERSYLPVYGQSYVFHKDGQEKVFATNGQFNRFLSLICGKLYERAPKINNELVNRQKLTAQMKKARNKLVDEILSEADLEKYQKGTSPEATIYRAAFLRTNVFGAREKMEEGCGYLLDEMERFIKSSGEGKQSFAKLYETLLGKGYGVRKGILPMFLALEFAKLYHMPIIYLGDKEVELTAKILENINEKPEEYSLYVEDGTREKIEYLDQLELLFTGEQRQTQMKNQRLSYLVNAMQKWYRSLPQFALHFKTPFDGIPQEKGKEIQDFRRLLGKMELNPRELLFAKIPKLFGEEKGYKDYKDYVESIQEIKEYLETYLERFIELAAVETAQAVHPQGTDLYASLKAWYEDNEKKFHKQIFTDRTNRFINYAEKSLTERRDSQDIVRNLVRGVTDILIEDWRDETYEVYKSRLHQILEEVRLASAEMEAEGKNQIILKNADGRDIARYFEAEEEDSTSYFLENAIEEAMEEFGDSLELNQKVAILAKALEKLISQ